MPCGPSCDSNALALLQALNPVVGWFIFLVICAGLLYLWMVAQKCNAPRVCHVSSTEMRIVPDWSSLYFEHAHCERRALLIFQAPVQKTLNDSDSPHPVFVRSFLPLPLPLPLPPSPPSSLPSLPHPLLLLFCLSSLLSLPRITRSGRATLPSTACGRCEPFVPWPRWRSRPERRVLFLSEFFFRAAMRRGVCYPLQL